MQNEKNNLDFEDKRIQCCIEILKKLTDFSILFVSPTKLLNLFHRNDQKVTLALFPYPNIIRN